MKSYSRLILLAGAGVSVFLLVASYFFFTSFSNYMMKNSAVKQADTIAQLTFSSMYQLMSKGWGREQVVEFADFAAASMANTQTRISFYRAEPVSRQFGEVTNQTADDNLMEALQSGRSRQVARDGGLTYHLPLVAQDNCLQCHTQAKRGDVLGAISVNLEFGKEVGNTNMRMMLVLLLLSPVPFIIALIVAVHLDRRFEDFAQDIELAGEAGKPADLSRVAAGYQEFQLVLDAVRKLLS